jgi:hypothetical protein
MSFCCLFKKILHILHCRYATPSSFKDYHNEPNHSGVALCLTCGSLITVSPHSGAYPTLTK